MSGSLGSNATSLPAPPSFSRPSHIYLAQVYPKSSPETQTWRLGGNPSSKLIKNTCFMVMRPSPAFSRRECVSEAVLPRYSLDELLLSVKGREGWLCAGLRQQMAFSNPVQATLIDSLSR